MKMNDYYTTKKEDYYLYSSSYEYITSDYRKYKDRSSLGRLRYVWSILTSC